MKEQSHQCDCRVCCVVHESHLLTLSLYVPRKRAYPNDDEYLLVMLSSDRSLDHRMAWYPPYPINTISQMNMISLKGSIIRLPWYHTPCGARRRVLLDISWHLHRSQLGWIVCQSNTESNETRMCIVHFVAFAPEYLGIWICPSVGQSGLSRSQDHPLLRTRNEDSSS